MAPQTASPPGTYKRHRCRREQGCQSEAVTGYSVGPKPNGECHRKIPHGGRGPVTQRQRGERCGHKPRDPWSRPEPEETRQVAPALEP